MGERVKNASVTSDQLKWLPAGSEMPPDSKTKFTSFGCSQDSLPAFTSEAIASRYPDIVLAKLRPGQAIELEAHAVKGIGKTHAKWSPVATAKYRMLPEVVLLEDIEGDLADELVRTCPVNVFDIEDMGPGERRATVARPRDCTLCRECVRGDGWDKRVQLRRVKEHFIFSIESTGALPPEVLFTESIKILTEKCQRILTELL
jgi:DNA-directed RNA polymerase I and III subunit RPAC1